MDQAKKKDEDQLFKRDEDQLLTARTILENPKEQRENGSLYRWAKLVVERHAAGESISDADDWLGLLMAGVSPDGSDLAPKN
jgi:hypothetical protein